MALANFYEQFFVQEFVEIPSDSPTGEKLYEYQDGREVQGLFKQRQSGESPIADSYSTTTYGRFAANADIDSGSFLRRAKDDVFIKIIGDPLQAPKQALTQVRTWESYITTRNEAMGIQYVDRS